MSYDGEPWDAPPWWWAVLICGVWLPALIYCAVVKSLWMFAVIPSPLLAHEIIRRIFPKAFDE